MTMQDITDLLDKKIEKNENKIIITFYEMRVEKNLSEEELDIFLIHCRTRLENLGYRVYFTGAKYSYGNKMNVVKSNELLVAIKD